MEQYPENYSRQLEHLLALVNDGKEGFKKASEIVSTQELKEKLLAYSEQRAQMADEFREQIMKLGGEARNREGDKAGMVHRAIMYFKTAFTKADKDDQAVLETCRTGDQAALDAFDDVLQGSILETNLKPFLVHQRYLISMALYDIEKLYFDRFKTKPEV